jgi:3-mercaptopyruvate sulfurtransferase SseA
MLDVAGIKGARALVGGYEEWVRRGDAISKGGKVEGKREKAKDEGGREKGKGQGLRHKGKGEGSRLEGTRGNGQG